MRIVGIALVGFAIASLLTYVVTPFVSPDASFLGFPAAFRAAWEPCPSDGDCTEWYWVRLGMDLAFWYGIGAGIVYWRRRRLARSQEKHA